MKRVIKHWLPWLAAILLFVPLAGVVVAQTGGGYTLTWSTMDGGGHTASVGGSYTLGGTVGQADTGVMGGGSFTQHGGFWAQEDFWTLPGYRLYMPLVLK